MYKKLTFFSFLPSILICIVLNLILFLTIPAHRVENASFWVAWIFTFPVNIAIAVPVWVFAHNRGNARKEDIINFFPPLTSIIWIATAVYLVSGICLMYPKIVNPVVPLVADGIITCIYGIFLYYTLFVTNRISNAQIETKQKVDYIRLLKADVEICMNYTKDEALLAELRALSEKIRFSDPMSHPSLADCEAELSACVNKILRKVKASDFTDLEADIANAVSLLEYRNQRCGILK